MKDKSFKRVLWLSPSERWRFCSAKPAPIPQERMLSLCESHGHKNEELIRLAEERMNASSCDCISVADTENGVMYNVGDETGEKLVAELEAQGVTCVSKIFVAVKRDNKTLVGQPCHDVIVKIWNMDERNKTAVTLGEGYDGVVTMPLSVMHPDR